MADMPYEDTQHLLDSITDSNFDQRLNDHMDGNTTEEVDEDTKVDMFTGLNNSAFQNHAQHGIPNEALLASNPFDKEFMEAYNAENVRTQASSGSDAQLSGPNNNGSTIADDDSQLPVSTAVTPATQFSSPMNPEDYLPESFQTQPYPPLDNQPQAYPVPMSQPFYDQTALQQMQPQQMQPFAVRQPVGLGGRQMRRTQYPQQQLFSINNQLHQPLPGQASHPGFPVPQPRGPLSQGLPRKGPAPSEPTRHKIPTNPANISPHTLEQQSLLSELQHFTHEYQGYITNPVQARQIGNLFLSLAHHEVTVTPPEMDPTFPRTNEAYRARVQELFMAIVDWSNPRGWRTKMGSKLAVQWVEEIKAYRKSVGLSVEPSDMLDHQIEPPLDRMPPVNEQWKNVVHRQLSNIEIEILSSKILDNKVLIHSALRSSWLSRITNSPVAELVRKENNKAGNDKKRNAASRLSGKGAKRPQNEESEDEGDGRKVKRKRY
ncbi:uncharacterized protein FTJAE_7357 [Fusarium tjaetaba]|uniref:Uncharacterized protein n=1 Tax=Fusarium tjaetaba TaxID=1567544 RepID=A0A8H5VPW5_9HYPO|nr:uncharacterized protein FTJAE_7357 [Fusarium tjaetaba]KAF5632972.1 hypothetical protein FTJAE_7357 [Fusarium tjaetaba]